MFFGGYSFSNISQSFGFLGIQKMINMDGKSYIDQRSYFLFLDLRTSFQPWVKMESSRGVFLPLYGRRSSSVSVVLSAAPPPCNRCTLSSSTTEDRRRTSRSCWTLLETAWNSAMCLRPPLRSWRCSRHLSDKRYRRTIPSLFVGNWCYDQQHQCCILIIRSPVLISNKRYRRTIPSIYIRNWFHEHQQQFCLLILRSWAFTSTELCNVSSATIEKMKMSTSSFRQNFNNTETRINSSKQHKRMRNFKYRVR